MSDDERRAEELYKKIRRVLNKLTPRKFELLFSQVGDLQIDTEEKLQKVVEMVAEKAMNESKFSVAYALMCKKLALTQVCISGQFFAFVCTKLYLTGTCCQQY
mgnify:FL=1